MLRKKYYFLDVVGAMQNVLILCGRFPEVARGERCPLTPEMKPTLSELPGIHLTSLLSDAAFVQLTYGLSNQGDAAAREIDFKVFKADGEMSLETGFMLRLPHTETPAIRPEAAQSESGH